MKINPPDLQLWRVDLEVDEDALDAAEGVVHRQVELELADEEELVGDDDLHGALLVPVDVGDELAQGHVELLNLVNNN